jgi:hypothetical protein
MKFCPRCGSALSYGARFCENCGAATTPATGAAVPPPVTGPPPVQPPAPPATGPVPTPAPLPQEVSPAASRRPSRKGLLTGLGGVVAVGVLGVVGYVVYDQLTGPNGGADSPQAAVLELSAAANGEDAVTALSLLPPGEVGPLVDLYEDVEAKATSTGVAGEENPLAGFDVRLDGVAVQVEELGEDVAAVTITSGTVSWALDPGQLQGALRIEPGGDERRATEGSADLVEVTREATAGAPLRIMTVQDDGRWYVSPTYTLLEAWRTAEGLPAPDFTTEPDLEGTGADSATAAVGEAALAVAAYDVDGLLDLLSPDEAGALYQYREAIITALHRDGALAELQSEGRLEIVSVDAVAGGEVDDRVPVTVRSASGGLYDDDGDYTSWSLDGNCLSWSDGRDTDGGCVDEVVDELGLGTDLAARFDSLTILTQEVDGRWYLSPMATVVSELRGAVAAMDADDVSDVLGVPQFGGVDGQLADGVSIDGSSGGRTDPALYEVEVPAGSVFSPCLVGDVDALVYGPDGRPAGDSAVVATDGGRYRVVVTGQGDGETPFSISPVLSSVEPVTLPATVAPAAGGEACGWRVLSIEATAGQPVIFFADDDRDLDDVRVVSPSGGSVRGSLFVPEETGTHVVTLAADRAVTIESLPEDVLTVGDSMTVTVVEGQEIPLRVYVPEDSDVRIDVIGGFAEARLLLPDGHVVDEDAGAGYDRAVVYPGSYGAGVYELVVGDFLGGPLEIRVREY